MGQENLDVINYKNYCTSAWLDYTNLDSLDNYLDWTRNAIEDYIDSLPVITKQYTEEEIKESKAKEDWEERHCWRCSSTEPYCMIDWVNLCKSCASKEEIF